MNEHEARIKALTEILRCLNHANDSNELIMDPDLCDEDWAQVDRECSTIMNELFYRRDLLKRRQKVDG